MVDSLSFAVGWGVLDCRRLRLLLYAEVGVASLRSCQLLALVLLSLLGSCLHHYRKRVVEVFGSLPPHRHNVAASTLVLRAGQLPLLGLPHIVQILQQYHHFEWVTLVGVLFLGLIEASLVPQVFVGGYSLL